MLKIEQLSISYEQKEVVHNFSFEVEQGEILSIIGPNGSGKSTILKAIARMQPYSGGNILFEGENMRRLSSKEIARKMCMLSQQNQAPSDISVKNLVAYGRYPHKKWFERLNAEDEAIIDWALEKTYLSHYKEKPIAALSGGEAQRAWIAMALAQRPQVLLLDEPFTSLDILVQEQMKKLLREIKKNKIIVITTHILEIAIELCDEIIILKDGKFNLIEKKDLNDNEYKKKIIQSLECENVN